ncbi:MAG: FtsX-like permease family protein [Leptospiraceae bacterium]|nr:FtsX-like permease family protein [Leptospiraceae bacterium]
MKFSFKSRFIFREIFSRPVYSFQFILAAAIGVGSVVGINSYKQNLYEAIGKESRNIMGGDLMIESPIAYSSETKSFIKENLPKDAKLSHSVHFASMIYTQSKETSLATVKALDSNFPLYGEVKTNPEGIFKILKKEEILLEETLSKNLKLNIGNFVFVGTKKFKLKGFILKEPGSVGSFTAMAPSAIITLDGLKKTGLESRGSRIRYNILVSISSEIDSKKFKEDNFKTFIGRDLTLYHNTEIGSGSQRFINSTFDYMSLLGLSAFFLGCISILISTRTRLKEKTSEIAVLKCLGASSYWNISIFIREIFLLSLVGTLIGIGFGYWIQFYIPELTGSAFLSEIKPNINFKAFVWGIFIGIFVPIVIGLESILKISRLSPLFAIRSEINDTIKIRFIPDLLQTAEIFIIYILFFLLASYETGGFLKGFILSGVILFLPILLFIFYQLFRILSLQLLKLEIFENTFRLVLKKINQTGSGLAMPIIGIGSALTILLLSIMVKTSLLGLSGVNQLERRPNLFAIDIRSEQLPVLKKIQSQFPAKQILISPIIGARLSGINNKPINKEETEKDALKRDWRSTARTREYFLSYRKELYDTEKTVEGKFWENKGEDEISIEYEFAKTLGVKLGDTLQFNVQGIEISGKITNTRSVNWADMKPNFVVLFSPGILESAPSYFITAFLLESPEDRYHFQKELISLAPNVTVIDVEKSIQNFTTILEKVTSIIGLMTSFIIVSTILLLISSLYSTKRQREEETSLLRVIGAASSFVVKMYLLEAVFVGIYSFLCSVVLSVTANYILSTYFLNLRFTLPITEIMLIFIMTLIIIALIYLLNLIGLFRKSAKEFLKSV